MQAIASCIWLSDKAEEAANFYTSIFPNSKIIDTARYSESGSKVSGRAAGSVMTVEVSLNGDKFVLLNGVRFFSYLLLSASWCSAKRRTRLILTGLNFQRAEQSQDVVGLQVSLLSPGKSFRSN